MIKRIEAATIPLSPTVARWQFFVFGWHWLTIYRWRLHESNIWWIYVANNIGIAFQLG